MLAQFYLELGLLLQLLLDEGLDMVSYLQHSPHPMYRAKSFLYVLIKFVSPYENATANFSDWWYSAVDLVAYRVLKNSQLCR